MHDEISRLRDQSRRTATRHLGIPTGTDRVFSEQVAQSGWEAEFMRLPVVPPVREINAANTFVVGFSAVGGPDAVA